MDFGYLGKGDKGQASLGSEDKNICVHIPFAVFLVHFFPCSKQQFERKSPGERQDGVTEVTKTQFSLLPPVSIGYLRVGKEAML